VEVEVPEDLAVVEVVSVEGQEVEQLPLEEEVVGAVE
jgi:hypothetical protein